MREIKFRGKRLDNGEWICGSLVKNYDGYNITEDEGHDFSDIDVGRGFHAVDPKTVGHYTVIKDKNGKDVYEGDITQWELYEYNCDEDTFQINPGRIKKSGKGSIVWRSGVFSFGILGCEETIGNFVGLFGRLEIIGNIHDNHEFLK